MASKNVSSLLDHQLPHARSTSFAVFAPGFRGLPDGDGCEFSTGSFDGGLEQAIDRHGDVLDGWDELAEFRELDIEIAMVEFVDDGRGDDALESGHLDQGARFIYFSRQCHLKFIIMPMSMGIVAFAINPAVVRFAQRRVMEPMSGGEFEFLAEVNHRILLGVDRNLLHGRKR